MWSSSTLERMCVHFVPVSLLKEKCYEVLGHECVVVV